MALEVSGQAASAGEQVVVAGAPRRVLVVVAARGHHLDALARAVDSVRDQHAEPADVVLVVPPAAAAARGLAAGLGVRIVDDPGRGLAAAVNAGLASAEPWHRYLTWLTPDDELLPGALTIAVDALENRPQAVLAFGDCRYLAADGEYLLTPHDGGLARARSTGLGECPSPSAMLIRRSELEAVGGLDETLTEAPDLDLFLKLRRRGQLVATGRTLAVFHRARRGPGADQLGRLRAEVARIRTAELPGALRGGAGRWWASRLACSGPRNEARAQRAADWR